MRIAFFGLPIAALLLLDDGHEIVFAGICRAEAPGTRRLRARLGGERVVVVPEPDRHLETLARLAPDLVVSWFWTRKLSHAVRAVAPLGAIGCHPSLLPRHRGPDPFFWAIDAGDAVTGITAHRLDDDYDTGAVLAQRELAIDPSWNAWTLAKRLDRPSLALLREVVARFARGDAPTPTAQDESLATQAPSPDDALLALDPHGEVEPLLRRIRAASPWPGASLAVGDDTLIVTRAARVGDAPRALAVGEIAVDGRGRSLLRVADGAVELIDGYLDGDDDERLGREGIAGLVRRAASAGGAQLV